MTENSQSSGLIPGRSAGEEQVAVPILSEEAKRLIRHLAPLIIEGECVLFLGNDLPLGYPKSAPPCRAGGVGKRRRRWRR